MSGWEWFVLATVAAAIIWALIIGFVVLWSQANKTAGHQWDQTMADHYHPDDCPACHGRGWVWEGGPASEGEGTPADCPVCDDAARAALGDIDG